MNFLLSKKLRNINYFSNYKCFFENNNYYIIFNLSCVKANELKYFREILSSFGIIIKARKSLLLKLKMYNTSGIFNSIYYHDVMILKIKYCYYKIFSLYYKSFVDMKNIIPVCILYNLNIIKLYNNFNLLLNLNNKFILNNMLQYVIFNTLLLLIRINMFLSLLLNYFVRKDNI